jgi:hypothetical protein
MNYNDPARDRYARRLIANMSPQERLRRFAALQAEAEYILRHAPGAMDRYMRRNLRSRAVRGAGHA